MIENRMDCGANGSVGCRIGGSMVRGLVGLCIVDG